MLVSYSLMELKWLLVLYRILEFFEVSSVLST